MSDVFVFFNDQATTEIYTLSLHDALPIFSVHTDLKSDEFVVFGVMLDEGEIQALATKMRCGVLMDERLGRSVA